ncbi:dihydrolipoyl dehydrogenase [Rhodococcus ruber]|uniref:dihydrolipoyl dehydrogenase n=1 Tax=Rhodococcus ruber TaxID=1830 RepID=UPI00315CB90F
MGEAAEAVDLLVIGSGPGGYPAALRAAELGRSVVLVDDGEIGGVCLNVGCIPSKLLIESAEALATTRRLASSPPEVDLAGWQDHRATAVKGLTDGVAGMLKRARVEVVKGRARFTSRSRVAIERPDEPATFLEFRDAIIATGSRPVQIPVLPYDGRRVVDSTGILALETLPERLVVVGAGYIGIELATAYAKLGSTVTVIEAKDRLLPEMDASFARPVARKLSELGVTVRTGCLVTGIDDAGLRYRAGDAASEESTEPADVVLVAAGRRPNTDDLGLDSARIAVDEAGRIPVESNRIVRGTRIAAIGDVTAGPMLAHKATAEGIIAAEALSGKRVAFDPTVIPLVVFSDPEIGSVGHTEESAREAGITAEARTLPVTALGRAATIGARHGFTRMVVDTERDAVIGVHICGPHASELISEGALAVEMAAAPGDLTGTIHPHPTFSEALHDVAEQFAVH